MTADLPSDSAVHELGPPPLPPRLQRFAIGGIAFLSALGLIGTALAPYLAVHHPLLLVALSADVSRILLVAGRVDPVALIAIGAVRRMLGMISTYAFGALWGFAVVRWAGRRSARLATLIALIERVFSRLGLPLLLVIPSYTLCVLAGAARLSFRGFVAVVVVGQIAFTWLTVVFGEAISTWTKVVIDFFAAHLWESTLVCALAVGLQQILSRRKRRHELDESAEAQEA